jgi:CRISPR/Cas system-associated endonuclease Cas1
MFNQFNLASDFMEPFRPFVDRAVCGMKLEAFAHDEKVALVKVLNEQITIDGRQQYMANAIRIYCKSLFDALEERDIALIRFPSYDL